jgi:hypothetical protein
MRICFIVGCARSGTSILGELIASHPNVRYIFEAHPIWELGGTGVNESHRLTAEHVVPGVREQIRSWFQNQANEPYLLVEKNPRNILRVPYIKEIFPEAKIIHIVRDGRDVACSMVPGCGGSEWLHLKPPSWKEYFDSDSGAIRCAKAWEEILEIGLRDLQDHSHLQIRYEDLLRSPVSLSGEILTYLGLQQHPSVIDFCVRITDTTKDSYQAKVQDQWFRDDHHSRIGRWRENLTPSEQQTIQRMLGSLLSRLGYDV